MKEDELRGLIDGLVADVLKSKEFEHIYKHLASKSQDKAMEILKDNLQDDLDELAQEGFHHEQMDEYHSSTSVSVDSDGVLELTQVYNEDVETLKGLYAKILSN